MPIVLQMQQVKYAIAAILMFTSGPATSSEGLFTSGPPRAACEASDPVSRYACRVHREALWTLTNRLGGLATDHGVELPAFPSPGAAAVEDYVERASAALTRSGVDIGNLPESYRQELILGALDIVPVVLSSALYGYELSSDRAVTPPSGPDDALIRGIGICGNHVQVFAAVLGKLGIQTRIVQFWWLDDKGLQQNHIALEAHQAGAWRLYDPTFGAYFKAAGATDGEPLGTLEARKAEFTAVLNPNGTTYRNYRYARLDPFAHLRRPDVDVTIGGKGVIHVPLEHRGDSFSSSFRDLLNFVGGNQADGNSDGISLRFRGLQGRYNAEIDVEALNKTGCENSTLYLNDIAVPFEAGTHRVKQVDNPETLEVRGSDDVCYVVLKSLNFSLAQDKQE